MLEANNLFMRLSDNQKFYDGETLVSGGGSLIMAGSFRLRQGDGSRDAPRLRCAPTLLDFFWRGTRITACSRTSATSASSFKTTRCVCA